MAKYPVKIEQILEGHVDIEANSEAEALKIASDLYETQGQELPDMETCNALCFTIVKED